MYVWRKTKSNVFFFLLGCPECFPDRNIVNPYNQKKMEELYEDTIRKVDYLEDRGFEVVQKWECELKKEMKEDEELKRYIDEHELVDPLQPREAFYGGRTNAAKLYHNCQRDEKIK